jgi:hypothetical protein
MAELRHLLDNRTRINERLSELRDTVRALGHSLSNDKKRTEQLMNALDDLSLYAPRLTNAVKDALYWACSSHGHRRLSAIDVKQLMEVRRYDFSDFPNPLASVHSTLRRLANQGEIGSVLEKGVTVYFWNGPIFHDRATMLAVDAEQRVLMDQKIRERVNQRLEEFSRRQRLMPGLRA